MKVFISIDLEGVSGVCHLGQTEHGTDEWQAARQLMRGDLDAVLEGCLEGGADEVVVCDAHDRGDNLAAVGLPAGVSLVSGGGMDLSMMAGLDASFDAVMMVGYHARAGTAGATLAHTYIFGIAEAAVCGGPEDEVATGELGLNAALAGALGVPLVFACGDDKLGTEARALVPGVETVTVKEGLAWTGARLFAPARRRLERPLAARALRPPRLVRQRRRLSRRDQARRHHDRDRRSRLAGRLRPLRRQRPPRLLRLGARRSHACLSADDGVARRPRRS